jgi:transposase InsO family protein
MQELRSPTPRTRSGPSTSGSTPRLTAARSRSPDADEPWRNGYVQSFNSRIRDECLNINIFWSLAQARVVITDWREDYNHRRRHSSLGYQTPLGYRTPVAFAAARANDRGLPDHSDIPPGGPRPQAVSSHARLRT